MYIFISLDDAILRTVQGMLILFPIVVWGAMLGVMFTMRPRRKR
ncbi:MAG: hypothetical protein ACYC55_03080 [Candidatus Geothermincolia bacterium]